MTDVNIAVEMLAHAFQDTFDTALLISADSDLTAPLSKIRTLFPDKRLILAFPPERFSFDLARLPHVNFTIGRAKFAQSQLPQEVVNSAGIHIQRPPEWR